MEKIATISGLVIFALAIALNIPSEVDIAETTIQTLQESEESGSLVYQTAQNSIVGLKFLGVVLIITAVVIPILELIGF